MKRAMTALAATAAALVVAVPLSGPAYAATPASTVDWKPCPDAPGVDCGTVTVPIDWSRPGGPTVDIALARRKATDPAARIGSVLADPGGPGGPGAEWVKGTAIFSPEITRRFDVVGFDPRGVGGSHPVVCDSDIEGEPHPEDPQNDAEFTQLADHNRRLGESCRRLTGPLFEHLDTGSVVRDMDAIRAALGDRKLTYYGVSYGTLMGQQYAETFPDRVRALALDSNMDHSLGTTWQFLQTETTGLQENFGQFVAWCDRTPSCALHEAGARKVFHELYAKAQRGELVFPGTTFKITPLRLLGSILGPLYGPAWRGLAEDLANLAKPPASARAQGHGDPVEDPFAAVFCQDWRLPVHNYLELDVYRRALAAITPDMKISPIGYGATTSCIGWPAPVRNPQHPLRVHGTPPLLMINSRYDPATPYQWATNAARQSGAVLLTYDGWGHGSYFKGSDCVVTAVEHYLITGEPPARGSHCAAVEPPDGGALRAPVPGPTTPRWLG